MISARASDLHELGEKVSKVLRIISPDYRCTLSREMGYETSELISRLTSLIHTAS